MRFKTFDLGIIEYTAAQKAQKEIFDEVRSGKIESALIFCRHYPVITLGRHTDQRNILASAEELSARQIKVYRTDRGGAVTYHGPGQLMVYPVFNLNLLKKDLHWYLRKLEDAAINFLAGMNLRAARLPGLTGVWIDKKKIASIGIAVKNWISFHGLSLNCRKTDIESFRLIRPCGMDITMISLEEALGRKIDFTTIKNGLVKEIALWPM